MSEINITHGFLRNISSRLDHVSDQIRGGTGIELLGFPCTPEVDRAFDDLNMRWDKRRTELADALECLAAGFRTVSESFEQTEDELVGKLEPSNEPAGVN